MFATSSLWHIESNFANLNNLAIGFPPTLMYIKWQDKISNENLYKNTKQEPIVKAIQRLRFIEHCLRTSKKELIKQYALYSPQPSRENVNKVNQKYLIPNK